jgi:N-methylhydantoinase B
MRLKEVFERFSLKESLLYFQEVMNYSERRMKAAIREIPNNRCRFEDYIEGDSIDDRLIKIAVSVEIGDEEILLDFSGTDREVKGPINCCRSTVLASVYYAIKSALDPDIPPNSGAYRPIKINVAQGSLLNANYPRPVCNSNIVTAPRIADVIFGAMQPIIPRKISAASSGTMNLINIGGQFPGRAELFNYIETYGGGQGAMFCKDGMSGVHTNMTNTRNAPIEAIEIAYPFFIEHYGLVPDGEGAGEYRGGLGMTRQIRFMGESATLTVSTDRQKKRPWGVQGGLEASGSQCFIDNGGNRRELPSKITTAIRHNDVVVIITPGGGGWGDPHRRDLNQVLEDVREGYISLERAKKVYGVVIDPETLAIDKQETEGIRKKQA